MPVNDRMTAMSKEDIDAWEKVFGLKKDNKDPNEKPNDKKTESENEMWPNEVCWEDWL